MLDLYCERTHAGLWAEPVNAITNIGFVIVAWSTWRILVLAQVRDSSLTMLIGLVAAIGIASFLFHVMATPLTQWLDVIPVLLFQLFFICIYTSRNTNLHRVVIGFLLGMFLLTILYSRQFTQVLNGSLVYLPALVAVFILGAYHYWSRKIKRGLLLAAAGIFLVSLFLRTIDNAICVQFGLGTHFLWHLLNALVIFLAMRVLIANLPSTGNIRKGISVSRSEE